MHLRQASCDFFVRPTHYQSFVKSVYERFSSSDEQFINDDCRYTHSYVINASLA